MTIQQYPIPAGGIPTGDTAGRPASPSIGDVYYNGQTGILEIYTISDWQPCSATPDKPTITVTDASSADVFSASGGKLNVAFTLGQFGGLPIQFDAATTSGGHTAFSSSSPVTLTGLTVGTAFAVFGNATNAFGKSANSDTSSPVTPSTLPEIPSAVTATQNGQTGTNVLVSWTLGANGGKPLSSITVTPFLNGTTAQTSTTAATTTSVDAVISGLTAGQSYTFKVKKTNANGTCADSTASSSITIVDEFNITYVIVAGGGGGGGGENNPAGDGAGGGGAGGYITGTFTSATTAYSIAIGAGGAGQGGSPGQFGFGSPGVLSRVHQNGTTFGGLTVAGGGGGGGNDGFGQAGGCGGGNSGDAGSPAGVGSVGSNGGVSGGSRSGGGGGGMGGAGGVASGGGAGGAGITEPIKSIALAGGGGGGGGSNTNTGGSATNGGGAGGGGSNGTDGKGGGGGGGKSGGNAGGSGGGGVIIFKSERQATSTTGSPIATTSGSFYIYEFQSTGTISYA